MGVSGTIGRGGTAAAADRIDRTGRIRERRQGRKEGAPPPTHGHIWPEHSCHMQCR